MLTTLAPVWSANPQATLSELSRSPFMKPPPCI